MTARGDIIRQFFTFMTERENIRLKRLAGAVWPWTNDVILQTYKFTNVRREHDRTSQLLRSEFYEPNYRAPHELILLNCAIARYIGTIEFMRAVGWQTDFRPRILKEIIRERLKKKERVYTGAYLISPCGHTGPKEDVVVDVFLADLWDNRARVLQPMEMDWETTVKRLMTIEGFGGSGFMAKETILDTRYTGYWAQPPVDRYTWTPVGPGSMRGAGRMLGHEDKRSLSIAETLEVCRELFAQRPHHFRDLELHDIQFQLCEFDKYERVRLRQGRPRSLYRRPQ